MKKQYLTPQAEELIQRLSENLLGLSAPNEGIHDGGEGGDNDDPTAKDRLSGEGGWGNIW